VPYSYWHFERSYCLHHQGQVVLSLDCSILKMEPVQFLIKSGLFCLSTRHKITAGLKLHRCCCENLKWHRMTFFFSVSEILNFRPNSSCRTTPCLLSLTSRSVYSRLLCLSRAYIFDPKTLSVRGGGDRRLAVT